MKKTKKHETKEQHARRIFGSPDAIQRLAQETNVELATRLCGLIISNAVLETALDQHGIRVTWIRKAAGPRAGLDTWLVSDLHRDLAFPTLEDFLDAYGEPVDETFRLAWTMARVTTSELNALRARKSTTLPRHSARG